MSPPDPYSLNDMFAQLAHFQNVLDRTRSGLQNPADKAKLGELLEQLRTARAQAEKKVPAVLREQLQIAQKAQMEMADLAKQLAEKAKELQARKEAEKSETKTPPRPAVPELRIDPERGQDLRREVLKAYGGLIIQDRFS
jgi:hypothetical protein